MIFAAGRSRNSDQYSGEDEDNSGKDDPTDHLSILPHRSGVRRHPMHSEAQGNDTIVLVEVRQAKGFLASFTREFTDADVTFAASGLAERGFHRLRRLNSFPPQLRANFEDDIQQAAIDDVLAFLRTVPHCEVRLT